MNFLKNNFNLFAKDKCKFTWYALNSVITGVSMQSLIFKISFWVFVSFNLKIRLLPMTFACAIFWFFPSKIDIISKLLQCVLLQYPLSDQTNWYYWTIQTQANSFLRWCCSHSFPLFDYFDFPCRQWLLEVFLSFFCCSYKVKRQLQKRQPLQSLLHPKYKALTP